MSAPATSPVTAVRVIHQTGTDQATVQRFQTFVKGHIASNTIEMDVVLTDRVAVEAKFGADKTSPIFLLDTVKNAAEVKKLDYLATLTKAIAIVHLVDKPLKDMAEALREAPEVAPNWSSVRGPANDRTNFTILYVDSNNQINDVLKGRLVERFPGVEFKFNKDAAAAALEVARAAMQTSYLGSPAPAPAPAPAAPKPAPALAAAPAAAALVPPATPTIPLPEEVAPLAAQALKTFDDGDLLKLDAGLLEERRKTAAPVVVEQRHRVNFAPDPSVAAPTGLRQGIMPYTAAMTDVAEETAAPVQLDLAAWMAASVQVPEKRKVDNAPLKTQVDFRVHLQRKPAATPASAAAAAVAVPVAQAAGAGGGGGVPPVKKVSWWRHPATLFALVVLVRFAIQGYFRKPFSLI